MPGVSSLDSGAHQVLVLSALVLQRSRRKCKRAALSEPGRVQSVEEREEGKSALIWRQCAASSQSPRVIFACGR